MIRSINVTVEVVCELIAKESIGYVSTSQRGDEFLSPAFASGHIYTTTLLDTLMAQSYFAPHVRYCLVYA